MGKGRVCIPARTVIAVSIVCLAVIAQPANSESNTGRRGELGFSVLNPGGVNLVLAKPFSDRVGLKLSGGYLGSIWGFQGNMYMTVRRGYPVRHDIALIAGAWQHDTPSNKEGQWTFGGVAYNFHYKRFFAETSLQLGGGDCDCDGFLTFELGFLFPAPRQK